jgi:hypothetical protein
VTYWFGVVQGLLKMNTDTVDGASMTLAGLPPSGWFGEGTAVKREPYRYNVQALRKSVVAGLPMDSFHWLLDHSIGFNRFVMGQLNERLGQFIAARDRPPHQPRPARGAQPGGAVPPGAVSGRGRGAAHHPARAGQPGRPVAPARELALAVLQNRAQSASNTAACACSTCRRCAAARLCVPRWWRVRSTSPH